MEFGSYWPKHFEDLCKYWTNKDRMDAVAHPLSPGELQTWLVPHMFQLGSNQQRHGNNLKPELEIYCLHHLWSRIIGWE